MTTSADSAVARRPVRSASSVAISGRTRAGRFFDRATSDRRDRFNKQVATGFVGIYTFELHFPESHSLKEKRMHLRSVKAQLTNRVACSIAEVDHHDVWQRSQLTHACVAREVGEVERLLDVAERWLVTQDFDVVSHARELVSLDD